MRTLSISSLGELSRSPLSIGSVGELQLVTLIPIDTILRGGSSDSPLDHKVLLARLRREDEEILAIIMAITETLE